MAEYIYTEQRKRRGKYSQKHYSPRLKRIIVLVYTQEVISTKCDVTNDDERFIKTKIAFFVYVAIGFTFL